MAWFVFLGVVAGVLAVDQRAGWQGLLSQPLFAACIVGGVMGELWAAVSVGVVLEVIYLSVVPMRGVRVSDQVAAGVVGSGTAGLLIHHASEPRVAFLCAVAVFLGLAAGEIGSRVTAPLFGLHNRFLSTIEFPASLDRRGLARRLFFLHAAALAFIFLVEGFLVLVLSAGSHYMGEKFTRVSNGALIQGTAYWGGLVLAIGAASIVHHFWHHRLRRALAVCAALAVIALWLV